jgi:hypothetical protein
MSNDEYQQQRLFCQEIKMKKPKVKVDVTMHAGLGLGISFPMTHYIDGMITVLCFNINFKWRKR